MSAPDRLPRLRYQPGKLLAFAGYALLQQTYNLPWEVGKVDLRSQQLSINIAVRTS